MTADVFISHAHGDYGLAEKVCDFLERAGIGCWIAPRNMTPGLNWSDSLAKAIDRVKLLVVIVSPDACDSRHVAREVERADSKGKRLIPFLAEECTLKGSLEYYLSSLHQIRYDQTDSNMTILVDCVREALHNDSHEIEPAAREKERISDNDLIALGLSVCRNVHEELVPEVAPEDAQTIAEVVHGKEVKFVDLACNRSARRAVSRWENRHGVSVLLVGEDLDEVFPPQSRPPIVCCLDSLDGTQHWLRSKNLYCTALSIFTRGDAEDSPYDLRLSMIQEADGRIVFACEDEKGAFVEEVSSPLHVPNNVVTDVSRAHVCTVCRRPDHYRVLNPLLAQGVPFAGLYTFGGNPVLVDLAFGKYDAVFQPDASQIGDSQPLWDWLPGGHIAYRSGCCFLTVDGSELDVVRAAQDAINQGSSDYPYVAATNHTLAVAIVDWLAHSGKTNSALNST